MLKANRVKIFYGLIIGLVIHACTTNKEAWLNRGYHQMTAHYNGYFNAKENTKQALNSYQQNYKEDYSELLPIYIYPDFENAEAMRESMNISIDKISRVLNKHSMPAIESKQKKAEWNSWIDDNWLEMAKAYFYMHNYERAEEILNYIINTYPTQDTRYYAYYWIARVYAEQEKYADAQSSIALVEQLMVDKEEGNIKVEARLLQRYEKYDIAKKTGEVAEVPKEFRAELYPFIAQMYIEKEEYNKAIEYLEKALEEKLKKAQRARYSYVLAQLKQEKGFRDEASDLYKYVAKISPVYEMEFNARINYALMYSGNNTRGLKQELLLMAEDEKNKEYLDQLYFALAELEFNDGNEEKGEEYLVLASEKTGANQKLAAKIFTRLADYYYDKKAYKKAKTNYDKSLSNLKESQKEYPRVLDRSEGLTDLVNNLDIIELNDSLIRIYNMPEKDRVKLFENYIEELQAKERAILDAKAQAMQGSGLGGGKGDWYWYNEEAKAFGYNQFKNFWGDRPNEDDWRRSNKSSISFGGDGENGGDSVDLASNDPYSVEYYLKDIPTSDMEIDSLKSATAEAHYNLGVIYRENFGEKELSRKYFEDLISRFPKNNLKPASHFQLYLDYKKAKLSTKSDYHKTEILDNYPNSEYAMLIKNPSYLEDKGADLEKAQQEYATLYRRYEQEKYEGIVSDIDKILANGKSPLAAKLLLLKVYTLAEEGNKGLDVLGPPLNLIIQNHSGTSEAERAQAILNRLRNVSSIKDPNNNGKYIFNSDMEHFLVLLYPQSAGKVGNINIAVSNFNKANFPTKNLKVKSTPMGEEFYTVVVRSFDEMEEAMIYYNAFIKNNKQLKNIADRYTSFVISHKNYASFYIDQDIDGYMDFFNVNYLGK